MHLGEIIKEFRAANKLSMAKFAEMANVSKAYISVLERNKRPDTEKPVIPSIPVIKNVAEAMGMSFDDLFNMLEDNQVVSVVDDSVINKISNIVYKLSNDRQRKVYNYAENLIKEQNGIEEEKVVYLVRGRKSAAGSMIHVDDVDANMGVLPSSIVPNGANELVQITGDSMEPIIKKGSEVYLRYQPTVEDGEIAIVRVEDEGVTCKYLFRDGKNIILKSENSKYDDIVVDAEKVSVIGKVLI
ncbi:helix-turn-helix domain-containing protein [Granulicatella adiacens]|jgi:bifunctional S24 family peptidase/transcriptional regulator|uniref:helix-turn-helix domain-containing protein n=1 Tax=Granulicatella adiacens TaxID=46124 RepID=UPI00205BFADD|nr:XRE family transcriptional regulator [Granulicatella adiacens]DAQ05352.1 MAG TPA: Repressor protein CI [Caudoviricetes sp.]